MELSVRRGPSGHVLVGVGDDVELVNRFLEHLSVRNFSVATRRAYAFDLLNFLRFCTARGLPVGQVGPLDIFDYLAWQQGNTVSQTGSSVVILPDRRTAASATVNRRVAAVRGLFEYAVLAGARDVNPVPAARRSSGARAVRRGLLGHLGPGRPRSGGRLVRSPQLLPESLPMDQVRVFIADLLTARDRAMALLMLLGGLRASEVRGLLLADVDQGARLVTVVGKGGKQRVVPVDRLFFIELANYLRTERPAGCATVECFVVLHGPTAGNALTEAGLRRIFRTHRDTAGTPRVRPHRLRHTYGTELAAAGIDLLALRELMGHASPETTARYVHLSVTALAAEYAEARSVIDGAPC
jgi:integrase/recombinase XerC